MGDNRYPRFVIVENDIAVSILNNCLENERTGCYVWKGSRTPKGYGIFQYRRKYVVVHRFLWEALNGPVPYGYVLGRRADCESGAQCCNPDHKELVKFAYDVGDPVRHRRRTGKEKYNTKLTEEAVRYIRSVYGTDPEITQRYLAKKYNVTQTTIWEVLNRKIWGHIK